MESAQALEYSADARGMHLETFLALKSGEPIRVLCDCGIRRDHLTRQGVPLLLDEEEARKQFA